VSHIINIQRSKKELEQEVKSKDQQKNKYADHISKLENRCRNQVNYWGSMVNCCNCLLILYIDKTVFHFNPFFNGKIHIFVVTLMDF